MCDGGIVMELKYKHNKNIVSNAKELRKNMTKEERHLWYDFLRNYPVKVLRQKIIGDYIVDFYCDKAKLVVELDGSQHYMVTGEAKDIERDNFLNSLNLKVLRFSNADINKHFYEVCTVIDNTVKERFRK